MKMYKSSLKQDSRKYQYCLLLRITWTNIQCKMLLKFSLTRHIFCIGNTHSPGGHWPRKEVWGCAALKNPFSRLSCSSQGSHFYQKCQFARPLLRKLGNFSLYSLIFCLTDFSSQAPKFGSSQAPKFVNFQFTSRLFWRQISVRKPHTSEIRAAHPYLTKVECPHPHPPAHGYHVMTRFVLRGLFRTNVHVLVWQQNQCVMFSCQNI